MEISPHSIFKWFFKKVQVQSNGEMMAFSIDGIVAIGYSCVIKTRVTTLNPLGWLLKKNVRM